MTKENSNVYMSFRDMIVHGRLSFLVTYVYTKIKFPKRKNQPPYIQVTTDWEIQHLILKLKYNTYPLFDLSFLTSCFLSLDSTTKDGALSLLTDLVQPDNFFALMGSLPREIFGNSFASLPEN